MGKGTRCEKFETPDMIQVSQISKLLAENLGNASWLPWKGGCLSGIEKKSVKSYIFANYVSRFKDEACNKNQIILLDKG